MAVPSAGGPGPAPGSPAQTPATPDRVLCRLHARWTGRPRIGATATAQPTPNLPPSLLDKPAGPAQVTLHGGSLSVDAHNSSLSEILKNIEGLQRDDGGRLRQRFAHLRHLRSGFAPRRALRTARWSGLQLPHGGLHQRRDTPRNRADGAQQCAPFPRPRLAATRSRTRKRRRRIILLPADRNRPRRFRSAAVMRTRPWISGRGRRRRCCRSCSACVSNNSSPSRASPSRSRPSGSAPPQSRRTSGPPAPFFCVLARP